MPRKDASAARNRSSKRLTAANPVRAKYRRGSTADEAAIAKSTPVQLSILIGLFASVLAIGLYFWYQEQLRLRIITPLNSPKIILEGATSGTDSPERFWGTYRPHTYFGMKTRSINSPVFGLMWMTQFSDKIPKIRHWCDQGDEIPMYTWFAHDGNNFGAQTIVDKFYTLMIDFIKRPGGIHGGDWSARVNLTTRKAEDAVVSLFFYSSLDGEGKLEPRLAKGNRLEAIEGYTEELGHFILKFPLSKTKQNAKKYNYLVTSSNSLATIKDELMHGLKVSLWDEKKNIGYVSLRGHVGENKIQNLIIHQVTVQLPFVFEVAFESGSFEERPSSLIGDVYQNFIQEKINKFETIFEAKFGLKSKGFDLDKQSFAKAALSNMIGGIGYFYGESLVSSSFNKEVLSYWRAPLFSAVPSRPFFPRGFLWDEGFHNLLIVKFDPQISKEIIGHWLDLMNVDGWIPREQILGDEARAKVPDQFVVQKSENANPPTFFLPLQSLVPQMIESDKPEDKEYLKHLFPRLKAWYNWYYTTQSGKLSTTYRWKGRDPDNKKQLNPLTLTSGLDDFPRASHPDDDERHLDLRCWMALAAEIMTHIAKAVDEPHIDYEKTYRLLTDNELLDELHWSDSGQQYSDYGYHSDSIKLVRPPLPPRQPGVPPPQLDKERVVKIPPSLRHINAFGYVSLFPFMFKFIEPSSWKLGKTLKDLQDPNLLWTKYGIRSLAKSAHLYHKHNTEHDPPYWRGAIWINFNYLILRALFHYSNIEGPHKLSAGNMYKELRLNLINNMYEQFRVTGYIWENYDDVTGKGKGSHPFTGWSALIVAIMAEQY